MSDINFSDEKKRRIIERAINKPAVAGLRAGIFGAEPCQVCGRVGTFRGWASAMATHWGGAFVCWPCRTRLGANGVRSAVEASPHRYCVQCLSRRPRSEYSKIRSAWACRGCRESGHDELVSRRRYVEITCETDEKLAAFDLALEAAAMDLEELVEPDLANWRKHRAAQRFEQIGADHGIDYRNGTGDGGKG